MKPLKVARQEFILEYVKKALEATGGRKAEAAKLLGISRKHLWEILRREKQGG